MSDFEPLVETDVSNACATIDTSDCSSECSSIHDKDDIAGMIYNAGKKLNIGKLFIVWLLFIFLHTEFFMDNIMSKLKGAFNDKKEPTIVGTLYASLIMMVGLVILTLIFD